MGTSNPTGTFHLGVSSNDTRHRLHGQSSHGTHRTSILPQYLDVACIIRDMNLYLAHRYLICIRGPTYTTGYCLVDISTVCTTPRRGALMMISMRAVIKLAS